MKEMVGGCCVCSDERGWQENPLVYCDGHDCAVAVHQACYGIVSVPAGPWFCEKCESQENPEKVKCELCPMREGAVKRADNGGWAHVVCALYIPEVRFGNVTTMDPIILSAVPPERYSRTCYICEEKGFKDKATQGACMQCNKVGCKSAFHVTCAQSEGLLCEESGQSDNIKYCGYCNHHFKKLKRDPSIKAVPPYKPSKGVHRSYNAVADVNRSNTPSTLVTKDIQRITNPKNCRTISPTHNGGTTTTAVNARTTAAPATTTAEPKVSTTLVVSSHNQANCMPVSLSSTTAASLDLSGVPSKASSSVTANHNGPSLSAASLLSSTSNASSSAAGYLSTNASMPYAVSDSATAPDARFAQNFLNTFLPTAATTAATFHANSTSVASTSTTAPISVVVNTTSTTSRTKNAAGLDAKPNNPSTVFVDPNYQQVRPNSKHKDKEAAVATGHKRRATDSSKNAENNFGKDGKIKKPRRNSTKKFDALLTLVSPVVEDCVSSFQREKVASQRMENINSTLTSTINNNNSLTSVLPSAPASATVVVDRKQQQLLPPSSSVVASSSFPSELADANYLNSVCNLIGPPRQPVRNSSDPHANTSGSFPTSLEQLLERQWEQGSHFLMEQAQHFDIASLLSCLHQLKIENQRLEDHIVNLIARRDHLLAVNARLSLPLGQPHSSPHSPRVNALPAALQQASTSHDYSLELSASTNSALSRVAAAVVSNANALALATASAVGQNPSSSSKTFHNLGNFGASSTVVSPPGGVARSSAGVLGTLGQPNTSYASLLGGGGGVFSSVKHKVPLSGTPSSSQDLSPDRQQQQQGSFVLPQIPTPQLAAAAADHIVRSHTPLLPPQFSLSQDHHQQMFYQLMQQQAAYTNALSGLMPPTSPSHRAAAAAALSQTTHLMQQTPPQTSSQSKT